MGGRRPLANPSQTLPAEQVDLYFEHVLVPLEERKEFTWLHQFCQRTPNFPRELPCIMPFTFREIVL